MLTQEIFSKEVLKMRVIFCVHLTIGKFLILNEAFMRLYYYLDIICILTIFGFGLLSLPLYYGCSESIIIGIIRDNIHCLF